MSKLNEYKEDNKKPLGTLTDREIREQKNETNVDLINHHENKTLKMPLRDIIESTGFIQPSKEELQLEEKASSLQKENLKRTEKSEQESKSKIYASNETVVTKKFDEEVNNAVNEEQNSVESPSKIKDKKNINVVPKNIANEYNEINGKYFLKNAPDTLAFVDKGQKIQAKLSNIKIAKSLVSIAEERNWTELKVTGTKEFKHNVWLEASQRGVTVKGYKPSESDLAELNQKTANKLNEIANDETKIKDRKLSDSDKLSAKKIAPHSNTLGIKADLIKDKSQEPDDLVKDHPDLVNEVSAIKIAEKFSQDKFSSDVDRERFVNEVRNNIANNLEKGQQNIAVKINEQQKEQEESHEI
ncbi:hypothetical protein [uncultured Gammaproteobacteria bacterium]|uniref:LPD7 domain-containing protein n=1 Tax=Bathymodiolus heckerae thiotrophic gill symbiont TaxID=1052212 RepID=UPI0010B33AC0|nr:LPD7 domain-containing protein [Bathymodiolus heckerae thiotrophic gill symbiont]CAC9955455.1 hypothetical protein [uncultured Gammaproteobacteria bacterium]SHN91365.1 hypothetical protein BHECKSOX_1667 [Bathymodiolus heckerae thiotrophic gill symbiont]